MSDSILQVNQIKDKGGNATGITVADSTGNVTVNNLTSSTGFPAGHVIQCQFVHMTGPWNHNSTTLTQVTDGSNDLLKAITPIKASSKILVMLSCSIAGGDSSTQGYLQLQRKVASGSYSAIGGGSDLGSHRNSAAANASTSNVEATNQVGYHFFDSPSYSVGNAITYRIMGAGQHPNYYIYVGQARQSGDANYVTRMPSTLTLLEIAN